MESLGQIGQHLAPLIPIFLQFGTQIVQGAVACGPAAHDSARACALPARLSCGGDAPHKSWTFCSARGVIMQLVPVFGQILSAVVDLGVQVLAALMPCNPGSPFRCSRQSSGRRWRGCGHCDLADSCLHIRGAGNRPTHHDAD